MRSDDRPVESVGEARRALIYWRAVRGRATLNTLSRRHSVWQATAPSPYNHSPDPKIEPFYPAKHRAKTHFQCTRCARYLRDPRRSPHHRGDGNFTKMPGLILPARLPVNGVQFVIRPLLEIIRSLPYMVRKTFMMISAGFCTIYTSRGEIHTQSSPLSPSCIVLSIHDRLHTILNQALHTTLPPNPSYLASIIRNHLSQSTQQLDQVTRYDRRYAKPEPGLSP